MKKQLFCILALMFSVSAFATQTNGGDTCNGNGSCATNNTYNTTNQGGTGGSATANGGNATVIDNSKTTNTNTNLNSNKNEQGQAQGQSQKQGQVQLQGQGQSQGNTNTITDKNKQTVVVEGDKQVKQAPGVGAASAMGTTALCRIAGGISLSVPGAAGSIAGSIEDENCAAIEAAKAAINAGYAMGDVSLMERGKQVISNNLERFEKKQAEQKQEKAQVSGVVTHPAYSGF